MVRVEIVFLQCLARDWDVEGVAMTIGISKAA